MALFKRSPKQKTIALIALLVLIAAGTAAVVVAATGSNHRSQDATTFTSQAARSGHAGAIGDVAVAASYLGLPRAQIRQELRSGKTLVQVADSTSGKSATGLIDAIVAARKAQPAAAVASGALRQSQASARLTNLTRRVTLRVNRSAPASTPRPGASPGVAAAYLGVSPAQVRRELQSGRTLAEMANATSGKSATGLIAALVADRKAKLAAAVAAGKLRQTNEGNRLAHLEQRIAAEVNG
jgi:hypothetical protein